MQFFDDALCSCLFTFCWFCWAPLIIGSAHGQEWSDSNSHCKRWVWWFCFKNQSTRSWGLICRQNKYNSAFVVNLKRSIAGNDAWRWWDRNSRTGIHESIVDVVQSNKWNWLMLKTKNMVKTQKQTYVEQRKARLQWHSMKLQISELLELRLLFAKFLKRVDSILPFVHQQNRRQTIKSNFQ